MTTFTESVHFLTCAGSDDDLDHWRGREGDRMQTCRSCGRISVAPPPRLEGDHPADAEDRPRERYQPHLVPWSDGHAERHGDRWPTHRARARKARAARRQTARRRARARRSITREGITR